MTWARSFPLYSFHFFLLIFLSSSSWSQSFPFAFIAKIGENDEAKRGTKKHSRKRGLTDEWRKHIAMSGA